MQIYGEKVIEHFQNPRNMGIMENADGEGVVGNPICGDLLKIYIKVRDDVIEDIKFQTFGCAAAIASGSIFTELVKGKRIEEALKITEDYLSDALGGLPPQKFHCTSLAVEAFKKAIEDMRSKRGG